MRANNDSLGVRSASVSGADRWEGPFEDRGSPNRLSSSGRIVIVSPIHPKCPAAILVAVDKIAERLQAGHSSPLAPKFCCRSSTLAAEGSVRPDDVRRVRPQFPSCLTQKGERPLDCKLDIIGNLTDILRASNRTSRLPIKKATTPSTP